MTDSRLFRFIVRALKVFPALMLAVAIVALGIEGVQFLLEPVNQLVPVQSALNGGQ